MTQRKQNKTRRHSAQRSKLQAPRAAAARRIHLRVLRDAATGREQLEFSAPPFPEAWQSDLAAAAANTAYILFGERANVASAERLAESGMAATSRVTESFFAQAGREVACRPGCDHCCHQAVEVTPPEAVRIYAFLKESRSETELEELTVELARQREQNAQLTAEERFSPEHPCPFLQDGQCSIYPVRPLACRGMNSLDAGDCASRLRDPEYRRRFLKEGSGGQLFLDPIRAARAVSIGIQMALSEHFYVDMRPVDLAAAMHLLLTRGTGVAEQWLAGDEGFAPALAAEATRRSP